MYELRYSCSGRESVPAGGGVLEHLQHGQRIQRKWSCEVCKKIINTCIIIYLFVFFNFFLIYLFMYFLSSICYVCIFCFFFLSGGDMTTEAFTTKLAYLFITVFISMNIYTHI
jgi:hypothetical protein